MKLTVNTEQLIGDLQWVVNSPSLISPCAHAMTLDTTHIDREHLVHTFGGNVPRKVGQYFERLVHYWLQYVRGVEVIAHGLQVKDGKRTLGEIDFLFRDERGRMTHWEVAVKFFLCLPDRLVHGSHFIGPNVRDTFERKLHRVFDHQLPLSRRSFPDVEIRQAFIKGRLFYSRVHLQPVPFPDGMSADHIRGSWLRLKDLSSIETDEAASFRILQKPFWLSSEIADAKELDLLSFSQLHTQLDHHFDKTNRPVLLSRLVNDSEKTTENDRIFVVSNRWPELDSGLAIPDGSSR